MTASVILVALLLLGASVTLAATDTRKKDAVVFVPTEPVEVGVEDCPQNIINELCIENHILLGTAAFVPFDSDLCDNWIILAGLVTGWWRRDGDGDVNDLRIDGVMTGYTWSGGEVEFPFSFEWTDVDDRSEIVGKTFPIFPFPYCLKKAKIEADFYFNDVKTYTLEKESIDMGNIPAAQGSAAVHEPGQGQGTSTTSE
jgi:hypothetical protein